MRVLIFVIFMLATISSPLIADNFDADNSTIAYNTCLASQHQGLLQNQAINYSQGQQRGGEKYYPKYKSESTATMLALFPGFFVHGLGHFYAEDFLTGTILLGIEGLVVTGVVGAIAYKIDDTEEQQGEWTIRPAPLIASIVVFLGSWIYDFAHADAAVRKYNDKVRAQIRFSSDRYNDVKVSLAVRF